MCQDCHAGQVAGSPYSFHLSTDEGSLSSTRSMPMMSAIMARLTPPRPSHSQNVEPHGRFTNEGKQPAVISPKYESQTSETSSDPQEKPLDDSLSRSNGRSRMHTLSALVTPGSSSVLENSGNLARDHLSIERTWLSYMRTGLSMTWAGVAVVQCFALVTADPINLLQPEDTRFFGLNAISLRFARPVGATMVLLALWVFAIGLRRYFTVQKAVMQGGFPVTQITVVLLSAAIATLVVVTIAVFFTLS